MDYGRIYQELVTGALGRTRDQFYERHHIVPKCMGGDDALSNLVLLTPEEHFIAHQLLVKLYPDSIKLRFALQAMLMDTGNHRRKNKAYGWVRRLVSENMKANNPNKGGAARLAYIKQNGGPPIHKQYRLTVEGRKKLVKTGSDNSNFGCPPWRHGRQTDETRSVWAQADKCYDWWMEHNGSYLRMSKAFGYERYVGFMNLVKKFKSGWVPLEDPVWLTDHR